MKNIYAVQVLTVDLESPVGGVHVLATLVSPFTRVREASMASYKAKVASTVLLKTISGTEAAVQMLTVDLENSVRRAYVLACLVSLLTLNFIRVREVNMASYKAKVASTVFLVATW